MSDYLELTIGSAHEWNYKSVLDIGAPRDNSAVRFSQLMLQGTGLFQATKHWRDRRIVNPTSNDDLDLTTLTQSLFGNGVIISFAALKSLLLVNLTTVDSDVLRVGNYGAGGFAWPWGNVTTGFNDVGGASPLHLANNTADGWPVTNSSNDMLRIRNLSANTVSYDISLVGI